MSPRDVPTEETLVFLRAVLPAPPLRVLEVGCGRGDLAVRLRDLGYAVTALDVAPDAVGHARAAGLDAVEADFLAYDAEPVDVVLFSHSLHHIHPPEAAVARAAALTRPGGLVVGEEFARERIDAETAAWQADVEVLLGEVGLLPEVDGSPADDPLARWREHHARQANPQILYRSDQNDRTDARCSCGAINVTTTTTSMFCNVRSSSLLINRLR